jgi:hypothetical protein
MSNDLTIDVVREEVESYKLECESLARQFNAMAPSPEQTALAFHWDRLTKTGQSLELLLRRMEKSEVSFGIDHPQVSDGEP